MAVERKSPLPVGRYWVVVFEQDNTKYNAWMLKHAARVKVRATVGLDPAGVLGNLLGSSAPGYWVQFDVLEPVPWVGIGYPNIVPAGAPSPTSPTDVIKAPEPEPEPADKPTVNLIAVAAIALAGFFLLGRVTR